MQSRTNRQAGELGASRPLNSVSFLPLNLLRSDGTLDSRLKLSQSVRKREAQLSAIPFHLPQTDIRISCLFFGCLPDLDHLASGDPELLDLCAAFHGWPDGILLLFVCSNRSREFCHDFGVSPNAAVKLDF